jgi:chloramphenicol O-acetyltransferase
MADFSSSGIWDADTGIMICHEDVPVSKKLANEFEEWIKYYDTCFKSDYTTFKKGKLKKLNEWGRKLAKKLKAEIPKAYVEYRGENEKSVLDSEII